MDKQTLINLKDDPRRCLKAIRLGGGSHTYCGRCGRTVHTDAATTELARRIDSRTLLFFQRCPDCNHKLYWQENHC